MPTPLIIDCDPGQDDAVALLLAMANPAAFDLLGITVVAGNVPLSRTAQNACVIRELVGRSDIPVFAGCPRPFLVPPRSATHIHGEGGIEGAELPAPRRPVEPSHAVPWLIETLRTTARPVTLATLGPLTNIAAALVMAPDLVGKVERLVMMGGAIGAGNVTASAEFNVYADPHAAAAVFGAGFDLTMIGLDVTHQARATPARIERIAAMRTKASLAVAGMLKFYSARYEAAGRGGQGGAPLHDPCVIASLLRPPLFEGRRMHVEIETSDMMTLGRTLCDATQGAPKANAMVMEWVDAEGYFALIAESLAALP